MVTGPPGFEEISSEPRPMPSRLRALTVAAVVGAAVVAGLLVRSAAEDAGRAAGEAMGASMEDALYGGAYADPYATGGSLGAVEQSEPVPPGVLGPDPVLDGYALQCFEGDLQSCDDLFTESPPLSDYEEYALTCGGRVKPYTMPLCTDLD